MFPWLQWVTISCGLLAIIAPIRCVPVLYRLLSLWRKLSTFNWIQAINSVQANSAAIKAFFLMIWGVYIGLYLAIDTKHATEVIKT